MTPAPALFPTPLRANDVNGLPILILGITSYFEYLAIDVDGKTGVFPHENVTLDWRYDWRDHRWVDVGETDGEKNDPPDGGSDLSGSIPEPDGVGTGDPFDEEGGSTPGDLGDLDTGEAR